MKRSIRLSLLLTGVCAVLPVTGLFAQDTAAPAATPSVAVPAATPGTEPAVGHHGKGGAGHMHPGMNALTPDERHQLRLARDKAMADPAVKEAEANKSTDKKAYRLALRDAMLKADPSIQAILDKRRNAAGGNHMKRKDLQTN